MRRLHVCAGKEKRTLRKGAFCAGTLTEKRILDQRRHGKAHFAYGPHQRAHPACERWLRREAVFADLRTPLRPHVCPQRRNSVHKCPKTAPRAHFRRSVYTPAYPRPLARPGGATGPTTSTAPWPRDVRELGPEAHATGTVTQLPIHTSSRSLQRRIRYARILL